MDIGEIKFLSKDLKAFQDYRVQVLREIRNSA